MSKNELVSCFQDTLRMCENGKLKQLTKQAKESTKVYKENFKSEWSEFGYQARLKDDDNRITVRKGTTFATAKEYVGKGKIGVLNFANPHNPGGGVVNGAMAQEECLCRSSNLYPCLLTGEAEKEYYTYNKENTDYFFSDRIIYSDNVIVFKTDDTVPTLMPEKEWFNVSVITCAAPYIAKRKHTNKTALKDLFKKRIENIFEVALENNIEILILGAFGCGAFKNPPDVVAAAFHEVITENLGKIQYHFKKIVFAIKRTVESGNLFVCPNVSAFEREFLSFSFEFEKNPHFNMVHTRKRIYSVDEKILVGDIVQLKSTNEIIRVTDKDFDVFEYAGEELNVENKGVKTLFSHDDIEKIIEKVAPVNREKYYSLHQVKNKKGFNEWKDNNKYFGKQFSILGDSISTFKGYNPRGYKAFYTGENCDKSGVSEMQHTWWGKVIDFFGGELLVNNSWSGSRVTRLPNNDKLFPSGCSDERTNRLHINNVNPDVIIVYLGTNDWAFGALRNDETRLLCYDDMEYFEDAYSEMLRKLKQNYPNAEIWCCTLNSTYMSSNPNFVFPETYNGNYIGHYNEVIRTTAKRYDCKLIDLYDNKIPYDSIDGTHPNADGMSTLATLIIRSMCNDGGKDFLDCSNDEHEYIVADEYTGGTKYICKKCGKVKYSDVLCPPEEKTEFEYVHLQPDATTILYPDTIKLYDLNDKREASIPDATVFRVGREADSVLLCLNGSAVSRIHATFFYEKGVWYLIDNNSTNGTWINETRLIPNKKYELYADDVINFAHSESFVFFKTTSNTPTEGDEDAKALAILEAGIETFVKLENKDEVALKLIVAALSNAPLYFPVELDIESMLGNIDPTKLKVSDTLQAQEDVRMKILMITLQDGNQIVPMFTSAEEAHKGESVSIVRYYPEVYLPILMKMDMPAVVNPFSDFKFILTKALIKDLLWPIVKGKNAQTDENVTKEKSVDDNMIGMKIENKYELLKEIGRGGVSRIYLAMDLRINKPWTVKICDKTDERFNMIGKEALLQETYLMMKLDHPAIPKIVDLIEDDKFIYIVREYVEGQSLDRTVREYGPQPENLVVDWSKQLCDVLNYLHTLNPPHIYRDMKPANVLLLPDGRIKLIDFGIMRIYKPNQSYDTVALGTRGYAAPEQYGGNRQTDARTDIYALGMTMHELLTGIDPKQPPYEVKPICQVNPSLSKGLEYIINKCIQLNPDDRYQNCSELLQDLNQYQSLPKPKGIFGRLFKK